MPPNNTRSLGLLLMLAMSFPMLLLYALAAGSHELMQHWKLGPASFGILVGASFALAALLSPWAGPLVQKLGARYSLRWLFICIAGAFAMLAVFQSYTLLLLAVALCGIAQAICNPATNLLIAQEVAAPQRAQLVGLKQAGVQVAALCAGLILQPAALAWGWSSIFYCLLPITLWLAWYSQANGSVNGVQPSQTAPAQNVWPLPRPQTPAKRLRCLMCMQAMTGIALACFVNFLPQFAQKLQMSAIQAGQLIALFGASGLLSRIVLTPLAARLREESWAQLLLLLLACTGLLLLWQATQAGTGMVHWRLWLAAILFGSSAVASNSIAMSMLLRDTEFGKPAPAAAWLSCTFFASFAIGPSLFGLALPSMGFGSGWLALVACLVLAMLAGLALIAARRADIRLSALS